MSEVKIMITDTIIQEFKRQIGEEIRLIEEGENRFYIYAISNDNRVKETTIFLLQFEKWGNQFHAMTTQGS